MNYQKIYNDLILKAKKESRRKYTGIYYERHHIIPKCLGGLNTQDNLILLTAKEHFIAHRLLLLLYPKNRSLIYAFWRLTHRFSYNKISKISSRDYSYAKELFNSIPKNKSFEAKQNMSKARKGKSYKQIYGDNYLKMKEKRKKQTAGKGNPLSKKYLIHNNKLDLYWFCHGNLDQFCAEKHVSGRTLQKSRKTDSYINGWKCIPFSKDISIPFIVY